MDGSARGKPNPTGIECVLRDCKAAIKVVFSKAIGVTNSNITELLVVREALRIFITSRWVSSHKVIIESDSSNVIKWVLYPQGAPWTMKKNMYFILKLSKVSWLGGILCIFLWKVTI